MKKILAVVIIGLGLTAQAQTIGGVVGDFFKNNPTNSFDVSAYGLNNTTTGGWGSGARLGYWLTPAVGAALDLSYCDHAFTFASLGLAGRGTIKLGNLGSISPYATAGPAWVIEQEDRVTVSGLTRTSSTRTITRWKDAEFVAVASAGATLNLNRVPWFSFFGEVQQIFTTETQRRIAFGITKRF